MLVAQQFDYPKTETDLKQILDKMYSLAFSAQQLGEVVAFKGLMEIISSETVIQTAFHNVKANKGSRTPGCDGNTIRDLLEKNYSETSDMVQKALGNYRPLPVRRVFIPKPGKDEKRPLGIPAILDRVIQECMRIVIEPILEAQFFPHSYGFRPMRSPDMALERLTDIVHKTGYHWILEGDISKYFDTINHTTLLKKLWHMGIRDQRVLIVIKQMLKAGIMNEVRENPMGTPQGGIISPLLANVYLTSFDWWVSKQWATKKTNQMSRKTKKPFLEHYRLATLKTKSNLKPAYLIRYADDWVLVTTSRRNAEKWKWAISCFLANNLNLQLSMEKTVITNVTKKPVHFLGYEYKVLPGKARSGFITKTQPDRTRLKAKVKEIHREIHYLRRMMDKSQLIHAINLVNMKIRGMLEYYKCTTWVNMAVKKYDETLLRTGYLSLRRHGGGWIPAKDVGNLLSVHADRNALIPAITHQDVIIGITSLGFIRFTKTKLKNQEESPYSAKGRELFRLRTGRRGLLERADDLLSFTLSQYIGWGIKSKLYNFEFLLNRAYAYNRDRGKCRICGYPIEPFDVATHHVDPSLPMDLVNKVGNLATLHGACHLFIHKNLDFTLLDAKAVKKVLGFREKLGK
jgi:RNA-directed DNA polymerase